MSEEPELRSQPVNYDVEDLVALSRIVPRARVQMFRVAAGAIVILLTVTIVAEAWAITGIIDWGAIVVSFFVAALLLFFSNRRFRAWLWLRVARRSPLYAPHSYAIMPNALRISSDKGVSDVRWSAFPEVKRVGERLFVFMSKRQAFIIPRRAFDNEEDFEAFATAAQERWRERHRL